METNCKIISDIYSQLSSFLPLLAVYFKKQYPKCNDKCNSENVMINVILKM